MKAVLVLQREGRLAAPLEQEAHPREYRRPNLSCCTYQDVMKLFGLRSDEELVAEARSGRPDAFETLIQRYQRRACAVGLGVGVRPDALQDVLQESFLQAFRDMASLRQPGSFGPWFLSIVRNAARMSLRKVEPAIPSPSLDSKGESYSDGFERIEFSAYLRERVQTLPEGVRDAIFLYYYEGESVKKVAGALGITRSAVKNRLQKGRALLREKLWRELGDCLRDMLPSTRDWRKGARRLALAVLAALPASRAGAMEVSRSASVTPALPPLRTGGWLGGSGVKVSLVAVAMLAAAVLGYGLYRGSGKPGDVARARGTWQPEAAVRAAAGEPPSSALPGGPAEADTDPGAGHPPTKEGDSSSEPASENTRAAGAQGVLSVRVVDELEAPVPDAEVIVLRPEVERRKGRTDDQGLVRFDGLGDTEVRVSIGNDPDFLPQPFRSVIPTGQEMEFALERSAWVRGVVLGPDGRPLPDVDIDVAMVEESPGAERDLEPSQKAAFLQLKKIRGRIKAAMFRDGRPWITTTTDDEGTFSLSCPPGTVLDLRVTGRGSRRFRAEGSEGPSAVYRGGMSIVVAPASDLVVRTREVALDAWLSVLVIDPKGAPAPSAKITVGWSGFGRITKTAGPDGSVLFEDLPREVVSVSAGPSQEMSMTESLLSALGSDVVPRGQEIALQLREGVIITGVVVDPQGEPVPQADVRAEEDERIVARDITDGEGRFRLRVLPGKSYQLHAIHVVHGDLKRKPAWFEAKVEGVTEFDQAVKIRLSPRE